MKKWIRKAAAAVMSAMFACCALPADFCDLSLIDAAITANAGDGSATLDEESGVLTLSGSVTEAVLMPFVLNTQVTSVVAAAGTVLPEDCSHLFESFDYGMTMDFPGPEDDDYGWANLVSVDFSKADSSHVKNMCSMFRCGSNLKTVDLSGFDTSSVTDMSGMFSRCGYLETIYVSDLWSMENVVSDEDMFDSCEKLVGGNGTAYQENHTDGLYARIDKEGEPGYFTFGGNYVTGASLTLDGKIGVNFYVNLNSSAAKAVVTAPDMKTVFTISDMWPIYDRTYKFSGYVNATQAGEAVTLKLFDADNQPLDICNSELEMQENQEIAYSVNDYLMDYTPHENPHQNALVAALDDYCKASENYFGLAEHDGLSIAEADFSGYAPVRTGEDAVKIALILNSETGIRVAYGGTGLVIYGDELLICKDSYYYISNIPAHLLGTSRTLTLGNTEIKNLSVLSYGYAVMNGGSGDAKLKTLVNALYAYAKAAENYHATL